MNRITEAIFTTMIALSLIACAGKESSRLNSLIPFPVEMTKGEGEFTVNEKTILYTDTSQPELVRIAVAFKEMIKGAAGLELPIQPVEKTAGGGANPAPGSILFVIDPAEGNQKKEGYSLNVTKDAIVLTSGGPAGIFYGMQTLRQLLPDAVENMKGGLKECSIEAVSIKDHPEYAYRGSMLDVSRHFFGVEEVKRYIDLLAFYKLNALHLHLSDDQGWRIEIKSWPQLTAVGGSTQVGGGKGGFYTQEDYKELVKYASDRYITIIPEIDMPGHTNAALASYAELNCNDTATQLYTGIEVGFSTLCTNKEVTFRFLDSVIRELSELTTGPYIHIGGDESHATKKEDYIPFMEKAQQLVNKYGKKVIGWDEIANSKLSEGTLAQYWADAGNANMAISKGAKLIMSPARKTYMDMQYDSTTKLGLHWAAFIEVDSAYIWDPTTIEKGISRENIEGIEAPLWTETIVTREDIDYMVFPRLPGFGEIAWSPAASRNWETYKIRLAQHGKRLEAMGIGFYRSPKVPWLK